MTFHKCKKISDLFTFNVITRVSRSLIGLGPIRFCRGALSCARDYAVLLLREKQHLAPCSVLDEISLNARVNA